jgi:hypothetical protein
MYVAVPLIDLVDPELLPAILPLRLYTCSCACRGLECKATNNQAS